MRHSKKKGQALVYNILFIRHGETDLNHQHVYLGLTEDPLNEEGREQARATGRYLQRTAI